MKNTSTLSAMLAKSQTSQAVVGCIETLNQGYEFLETLQPEDYTYIAQPHVSSSIGEHYRHWLDLFHAIRLDRDKIDYNVRRRGHNVERDINVAKQEIAELIEWLFGLPANELNQPVQVETEVMLSQTHVEEVTSTFVREITFAALHATHHFAMAKVVASLRGVASDSHFGVAPTTATYQRAQ
ncbi:hypothetical protein TW78_17710 [Vibrio coralliilyticus]|uniref:DinB family protein n=2 Tax=Vibrio TaxID=662 RepID=A0A7Y4BJ14_9VIBR|nr:hypothetical protein JV59_22325 [Vibrio coralliilyticus]ERB63644.1 hypothetical protein N779_19565 [Vibrio coralliilyticus OCN008]AIW20716.1 hypothetical protein IX92_16790 [Vibrio coralliilyticus]AXN34024.1 hypothetical protein DVV14_22590 [Vibrio coralliilyticus]KJY70081.1 hypothetical protein TW78_17710 [Vibrio coralliilyticus]